MKEVSWEDIVEQSESRGEQIEAAAQIFIESERTIFCWAMGLTQHKNAVANIQEIVNLMLLRGQVGKPGAGFCPVRGHSNVQGDRTMGIWERPTEAFLDKLGSEFGFEPPRDHGSTRSKRFRRCMRDERECFLRSAGIFFRQRPTLNTRPKP